VLDVLLVTFPFFALVLCGYVGTRLEWLPQAAIGGSTPSSCTSRCPACCGASAPRRRSSSTSGPGLVGVYVACAIVMVAFTVA
jgi:hypothetical protein